MAFIEKDFFGLDIGARGMRLVQLKPSGGKPSLVTYTSVEMPEGLSQSDSATDRANVSAIIKQLVKSSRVGTKKVVASLPGNRIYSTVVKVPKLSASELASAIKWQAEQYLPVALDEVKLDWSLLPTEKGATTNEMEVWLVAAPIGVIEKYTDILDKADLEVLALEINPLAVARALVPPGAPTVAIVDIGALNTDIVVVHNNVVYLSRSVQTGGDTLTRAVAKGLGLEAGQAEQFKQKFGLTQDKLEGQVYKAIRPIVDSVIEEIKRSIKFFEEQKNTAQVSRVILTGGTAALPELAVYLANSVGLEVQIGNSWSGVSYPGNLEPKLNEVALEFTTAVGLAMRGMR